MKTPPYIPTPPTLFLFFPSSCSLYISGLSLCSCIFSCISSLSLRIRIDITILLDGVDLQYSLCIALHLYIILVSLGILRLMSVPFPATPTRTTGMVGNGMRFRHVASRTTIRVFPTSAANSTAHAAIPDLHTRRSRTLCPEDHTVAFKITYNIATPYDMPARRRSEGDAVLRDHPRTPPERRSARDPQDQSRPR
ncbi:hypothetical protein PYCCODRAFT_908900 [Trametes coccinea BRFM310]|uniref:Uncharacterized protein n=1 Tax=Trametes coccinea (strain BRFM310) TaxID=1353009 RepID=A0A1Y2ICP5_TRAC3|nr:hypothetical protein PYCCODRAFT_908900 [Trametes coccinea BRFM310]